MAMKLVLKPTSGETDVKLISMIQGWQLQREIAADATMPRQILWVTPDGSTSIVYVEDQILQLAYLLVNGPEEATVQKQVVDGLEIYTSESLQRLASPDVATDEAITLVNAAAVMAPADYDAEVFAVVKNALRHADLAVRRTAVFAVTYMPWRQFRDLLVETGKTDPDLTRDVQVVTDAIDAQGWR